MGKTGDLFEAGGWSLLTLKSLAAKTPKRLGPKLLSPVSSSLNPLSSGNKGRYFMSVFHVILRNEASKAADLRTDRLIAPRSP